MNISSNISSINTNQTMMNINSKSIANNQADLEKALPEQIVAEKVTSANVSAIKTQDEMLGSLLDIKV